MMLLAEGIQITSLQVAGIGSLLAGAIALLYKTQQANNAREIARLEKQIADLESDKRSFEKVASEAVEAATNINNFLRAKEGRPPTVPLAPVVTESGSPSSAKQRDSAKLETFKARIEAIKLETGQAPRPEPERGEEPSNKKGTKQ